MLDPDYPLQTERLLLRPYESGDLEFLLGLFGREDVCRYLNWPPMDETAARSLLERRLVQSRITKEGEGISLVAVERAGGRAVGELVLSLTSEAHRQGEVGWSIRPDRQGLGYATEAAGEILRLGFEELGLHRIVAECDPRHGASIAVMERLGMRHEAHHLETAFIKGEWVGSTVYALLESEWRSASREDDRARRG
jgi:RimJ/RimL family protein N-acetyltransferase